MMEKECRVIGCEREILAKGYCGGHYQQVKRGEYPAPIRRRMKAGAVCHCGEVAHRLDLCREHFNEYMRNNPRPDRAPKGPYIPVYTECPVTGCDGPVTKKGFLCRVHRTWAWKYGIPYENVPGLLESPTCSNAACLSTLDLVMDHDHSCCSRNKTCGNCNRGFLCRRCNTALGMLRDDPTVIQGLLAHLLR